MDVLLTSIMLLMGLVVFLSYGFHYLIMIISLEMVMLSLVVSLTNCNSTISNIYYFLFFMVIVVCMGSFGVTLIISSYRTVGTDLFIY